MADTHASRLSADRAKNESDSSSEISHVWKGSGKGGAIGLQNSRRDGLVAL